MADKRIIQLPDTPGLDTTTDEMVVDNATDGARRVPVGRAGGVASLDSAGVVAAELPIVGYSGSWARTTTTEAYDAAPVLQAVSLAAAAYPRLLYASAAAMVQINNTAGYWRGRIVWSMDGGTTWTSGGTAGQLEHSGGRIYTTLMLGPALISVPANTAIIVGVQVGNGNTAGDTVTIYEPPTYSAFGLLEIRAQ
ncbi:hypothetical protein [Oceanithermus sp.]|uniref:hypothetical protein n=1 Tax=Oceanithermus sp. TaxID=2268145 RepID=UPI00257CF537|nr:hypothetical protein [Oceanithermus sp.]